MAHKIRIAPGLHWMVNCPALNNGHDTLRQHCKFLRAALHNGEHDSQSMMHHLCVPLAQKTNHQSIQCLKAPKCNEIKLAGIYTLGTFRLKGRLHSGEWCDGPRCRSSKFVHKFISILSTWRGWRRRQHTSMMAVTATQFTGVSNTIVERCVLKCRSKAITVVCRCCGVCTLCFIHIQRHLIFIYFWAFFLSFLVFFSS